MEWDDASSVCRLSSLGGVEGKGGWEAGSRCLGTGAACSGVLCDCEAGSGIRPADSDAACITIKFRGMVCEHVVALDQSIRLFEWQFMQC